MDVGALALSCVTTYETTEPLRAALAQTKALQQELAQYRPPTDWAARPHFRTDTDEDVWRMRISQELCDAFIQEIRDVADEIPLIPPMTNSPRDYLVPGLPWSYANPVSKVCMRRRVGMVIASDSVLSSVFESNPDLLMRRWWEELEGWCRAYFTARALSFDSVMYASAPADYARAEKNWFVSQILAEGGFDLMARIRTELWSIFPGSRQAGLWVSYMRSR
jgi:hypothetical protein